MRKSAKQAAASGMWLLVLSPGAHTDETAKFVTVAVKCPTEKSSVLEETGQNLSGAQQRIRWNLSGERVDEIKMWIRSTEGNDWEEVYSARLPSGEMAKGDEAYVLSMMRKAGELRHEGCTSAPAQRWKFLATLEANRRRLGFR